MEDILKVIVEQRASDGFVLVDAPITIKVDGNFVQINKRHQTEDEVRELIMSTMSPAQRSSFALQHEANYAITHPKYGRFRATVMSTTTVLNTASMSFAAATMWARNSAA